MRTLHFLITVHGSLIFFEKIPGGTLLLGWGRLFIFHTNYRGVDYLGGVADILGLLRHIFWHFSSKRLQGGHLFFYDSFLGGRLFRWGRLFFFIVSSGGVAYFGGVVYSGLKSRELWIAKKRQPRVTMAFAHCSTTTTIIVCVLCNV